MENKDRPLPASAAGDNPPAAGRDDSTGQALARSREIRGKARLQIQAARECVAAARRRRSGPGATDSWPIAPDPVARRIGAGEEIERAKQARARLAALAARLVQTEETVARIHEEMAGRDSRRAAQYLRAADDARQAACFAREIQCNAAGTDPR